MRPRSVGFGGRFVGRRFVAKGVTFLDFTLKRPLVVHIDEPRPRLMSSTSPFRTDAPRSGLACEFCGRFTLQYGILQHMAVAAPCWALFISDCGEGLGRTEIPRYACTPSDKGFYESKRATSKSFSVSHLAYATFLACTGYQEHSFPLDTLLQTSVPNPEDTLDSFR